MSYGGYSHGRNLSDTEQALHERRTIRRRRGNAMWAMEGQPWSTGIMPADLAREYRADDPTYTVMSYDTPIAWVTRAGLVRIPDVKYSPTTTQHQWTCKYHLAEG
jgi:hypothetical protein